ncbi:MAG: CRTAC1 family protein [Acidobacteria bacterium]|nr:CRTAC1 family protein [Acidobacteriota bacterium]
MRPTICGAILSALLFATRPYADVRWFEDITAAARITAVHRSRAFENRYAEILGGNTALGAAAAVADFDRDGFEDIFLTSSSADGKNVLYRNNGDLTFTDVAARAGVADGNDRVNASADALWFDYNNDSAPDLFVVRFGRSQLFRNLGNGRFEEVTHAAGLTGYLNAVAAVAFDYDRDGFVDLFVGSYFAPIDLFDPPTPRFFPESLETANNGGGVIVFRNRGNGTFADVTKRVGLEMGGWTLDLGHADADNDGDEDLYVACDFGTDRFFVNNGDGTFTDLTERAIGIDTKKGMNAEWGDFDGDGRLDVYVTNITDDFMREGNFLWRNNGDLTFTDVSRETGTFETGWAWGAQFFDYDNDGWLDLYVMNGWVSAGPESYAPDILAMIVQPNVDLADVRNWPPMKGKSLSGYQHKRLFRNVAGGSFVEEAARHGLDSIRDGRGIGVADFDNDGRQDLIVSNANAAPFLYRNVAPRRHWIELVLRAPRVNRLAIGAQVRVTVGDRTLLRFVNGGNGFEGQSTTRVHAGLGDAREADRIEIRWPDGTRQHFDRVAADQIYEIEQGDALTRFTAQRAQHAY